jgi:glycosyltransferase involved in cell wall biosynthesis
MVGEPSSFESGTSMVTVHFCIESYDPRRGGMEESALRLITALGGQLGIRFVAYVLSIPLEADTPAPNIPIVDIASTIVALIEPLGPLTPANSRERMAEKSRLQVLFLRRAIRDQLRLDGEGRHVLLSYYLSTAGFVAQHVACEFGMAHIACARGSDLGRDIFTRELLAPVEFVLRRAACVVTTSQEHARFVRYLTNREDHVHTIYNAVPAHIRPSWTHSQTDRVRLVSLGGYSIKKGTHTLLKAVSRLLDEGLPVELAIAGPTGAGHWDEIRQHYSTHYAGRISLCNMIARPDVEAFLLAGDVFCSASISEGCANSTMLALGLGMPIVSTATGALIDFTANLDHVATSEPGDEESFASVLRRSVQQVLRGTLVVDFAQVEAVLERLSQEREASAWQTLFNTYSTRSSICASENATSHAVPLR